MLSARRHLRERLVKTFASCQLQNSRRNVADLGELRKQAELRYADKLHDRVKREGVSSLDKLKSALSAQSSSGAPSSLKDKDSSSMRTGRDLSFHTSVRKDSSPIKPLADLMDIGKLFAKEHTPEQVSTLWTTYHASRSHGTGRGYLSAIVPLKTYVKMTSLARKFPEFLLPLPRPSQNTDKMAHEFYFLQWTFHAVPSHQSQTPLPSEVPVRSSAEPPSTVLFTPLQEYKLRQTFAQPYLVLTHYTDLATTHGIVLLRGEITASSAGKYLMSQVDAQLLALGVQRFYLASGDVTSERRAEMLRKFHEKPEEFQWEELLTAGNLTS